MTERPDTDPISRAESSARELLAPEATTVAAAVLAWVALTGNGILVAGLQAILGQGVGRTVGPYGYLMSQAAASLAIAVLVLLLARPGLRATGGWVQVTARAAVILAALALVGSLLVLVAGLMTSSGLLPF